jgi:hypothetical protein
MTGPGRFWARWLLGTVAVFGLFWVLLTLLDLEPRPWRLLLLVGLLMSVLALVSLGVVTEGPDWEVVTVTPVTEPGQDARLAMYTRVIGGHLDSRQVDPGLRDRLATLTDARLRQRLGIGLDEAVATGRLDRHLVDVVTGPPRRLTRHEIETCVRRIEEL